jgi:hypothetical protein
MVRTTPESSIPLADQRAQKCRYRSPAWRLSQPPETRHYARVMSESDHALPEAWWTVLEPGTTYARTTMDHLPALPEHLVDSLSWLDSLSPQPRDQSILRTDQAQRPLSGDLVPWLTSQGVPAKLLPEPLRVLASRPELLGGIASVTLCFVDFGDQVVVVDESAGGGWLVRFMTDSQAVLSWLIHIEPGGVHSVVVTPAWTIGYDVPSEADEPFPVPTHPLVRDDLRRLEVEVCAHGLTEFLARLWLENQAWLARHGASASEDVRRYMDDWVRLHG